MERMREPFQSGDDVAKNPNLVRGSIPFVPANTTPHEKSASLISGKADSSDKHQG
jgi:hypothetical protein